jgi:hypothetical protein
MASPGEEAGCLPLLSPAYSLLSRFFHLANGGLDRSRFLIRLLEVFLKILVKPLLDKVTMAALQPVCLHLLVKEVLALFGVSGHFGTLLPISAVLAVLSEATEPFATFLFPLVAVVTVGFIVLGLLTKLGRRYLQSLVLRRLALLAFGLFATTVA